MLTKRYLIIKHCLISTNFTKRSLTMTIILFKDPLKQEAMKTGISSNSLNIHELLEQINF